MAATTEATEADDWQLAGLARNGDEDAYAQLIARHQRPIHAFIYRHVTDTETACDLTQEVFVRAWFALDRARPQARFSTWLFQIAINLCRDHAKSKATRQARLTDSLVLTTPEHGERERERELPNRSPRPDQIVQSAESISALESEIGQLPIGLREAFLLGAVEGWPHKEIAATLGLSAKAVEVRIRRARRILSERLAKMGYLAAPEGE